MTQELLDRIFYLNLFKSFILSKVEPGSIIKLIDLDNFVVVKGTLVSKTPINLFELGKTFSEENKHLFQTEQKINTIDILSYNFDAKMAPLNVIAEFK